jgi:hypothetical protein
VNEEGEQIEHKEVQRQVLASVAEVVLDVVALVFNSDFRAALSVTPI